MARPTGLAWVVLTVVCSGGCVGDPDRVYVRGPEFSESLSIRTEQGDSASVKVGEPLVLHAVRTSGPWVEVDRDSLAPGACWWAPPPPPIEGEVAGNLRWQADPAGAAEFNTRLRTDGTRQVRFTRPGIYRLTAESSGWCGPPYFAPEALVVQVAQP